MLKKLTSRKLWMALACFVSGLFLALGGKAETVQTVAGAVMCMGSAIGYMVAESHVDAVGAGAVIDACFDLIDSIKDGISEQGDDEKIAPGATGKATGDAGEASSQ